MKVPIWKQCEKCNGRINSEEFDRNKGFCDAHAETQIKKTKKKESEIK